MASEPLTNIEVEYPDPKERQAAQRLEPLAEALGLSLSVLRGTSNNADTRVDATQALVSKLRALFGDQV